MTDWIRVDDPTRDWPEGVVVAYAQNPEGGSAPAHIAYRDCEGAFSSQGDKTLGAVTHFFYLPKEPRLDEGYGF